MRTQKYRSLYKWNMQICNGPDCDDDRMWPVLEPCGQIDCEILPARRDGGDFCGHLLNDQRKADLIWERPERYETMALCHSAMVMPTYPITGDMPLPMQVWNAYRGRAIAYYWQCLMIQVVPVLQWSYDGGARRLFGGLPSGGTLAVEDEMTDEFDARLSFALTMLEADAILIHGENREIDLPCEAKFFQ